MRGSVSTDLESFDSASFTQNAMRIWRGDCNEVEPMWCDGVPMENNLRNSAYASCEGSCGSIFNTPFLDSCPESIFHGLAGSCTCINGCLLSRLGILYGIGT